MRTTRLSIHTARVARPAMLVGIAFALAACSTFNRREQGAVIGAAGAASRRRGREQHRLDGARRHHRSGCRRRDRGHHRSPDGPAGQGTSSGDRAGAAVERVGEGIQVTFASGLLYDFDSDAIRPEAARNLQNLATSLRKYPNTELLIVGHTDALGSADYNQDLSTRRANSASSYLTTQGIGATRLRSTGKGEVEAVASNDTEAGRQVNRRIEVAIFAGAAARTGSQ